MNVTNPSTVSSFGGQPSDRKRSMSVIKLATALALIALPATVLFPTIAQPDHSAADSDDIQLQLAAAISPKHNIVHSFSAKNVRLRLEQEERVVVAVCNKYTASNGVR